MGKRRRGKGSGPKAAPSLNAASENEQANDLDEDFIQYESSDADDANGGDAGSGSESVDSESSSDHEMVLNVQDGNESEVEATFEFFDPTNADVNHVAVFLTEFCHACGQHEESTSKGRPLYLVPSELAKTVCEQTRVGTMVKLSDEPIVIAFITCLNIRRHQKLLTPLGNHLSAVCKKNNDDEKFFNVLRHSFSADPESKGPRVGLILTEKLVNLPPELAPKMQEALFCEIEWAKEDEPTEELRKEYIFDWYLYITEVFVKPQNKSPEDVANHAETEADEGSTKENGVENVRSKKKQKPAKKKMRANASTQNVVDSYTFTRVEDEAYLAHATHHIVWSVQSTDGGSDGYSKRRIAMLIKAARIEGARKMVKQALGIEDEEPNDEKGNQE